ncbi:MAG: flagellar basal body-associated FliL family protein [Desulfovibrio sp.]|nr:flagellar basal body-associated FliL family protein [Desulfovibrio sp.]
MAEKQTNIEDIPKEEVSVAVGGQDAVRKVELDLDDAPFLKEDAPPVPAEKTSENLPDEGAPSSGDASDTKGKKKKILLFAAIGLVVLLVAATAVWWFVLRTPPPPPPPPDEPIQPDVIVVPSAPSTPTAPTESVKELAAFVIPRNTPQGTRFLVCKFSSLSTNPAIDAEIDHKLIPIRDALYYYLSSKTDDFLLDAANAAKVKHDLTGVLNDYITQGKVEDVLFESYLNE